MKKVYLANSLFWESDRAFNEKLAKEIENITDLDGEKKFTLYVPQRNDAINDKNSAADSVMIYDGDTNELLSSDIIVAVLDGTVIDEGVASEIGWVAGYNEAASNENKKYIIGLSTDFREASRTASEAKNNMMTSGLLESQYPYKNLYTVGCVKKFGRMISSSRDLIEFLKKF